jgi:hypothetical protein
MTPACPAEEKLASIQGSLGGTAGEPQRCPHRLAIVEVNALSGDHPELSVDTAEATNVAEDGLYLAKRPACGPGLDPSARVRKPSIGGKRREGERAHFFPPGGRRSEEGLAVRGVAERSAGMSGNACVVGDDPGQGKACLPGEACVLGIHHPSDIASQTGAEDDIGSAPGPDLARGGARLGKSIGRWAPEKNSGVWARSGTGDSHRPWSPRAEEHALPEGAGQLAALRCQSLGYSTGNAQSHSRTVHPDPFRTDQTEDLNFRRLGSSGRRAQGSVEIWAISDDNAVLVDGDSPAWPTSLDGRPTERDCFHPSAFGESARRWRRIGGSENSQQLPSLGRDGQRSIVPVEDLARMA